MPKMRFFKLNIFTGSVLYSCHKFDLLVRTLMTTFTVQWQEHQTSNFLHNIKWNSKELILSWNQAYGSQCSNSRLLSTKKVTLALKTLGGLSVTQFRAQKRLLKQACNITLASEKSERTDEMEIQVETHVENHQLQLWSSCRWERTEVSTMCVCLWPS